MMQRMFLRCAAATSLAFLLGCSTAQPPAPPDTRAADEQAIRDGEAQWVKDFATKDPEKVLAHYADNADSMIPEMKLMTGHDSIRAGLKDEFSDPNSTLDFHPDKVTVAKSGDLAYSQGTYNYTSTDPKTKKPVREHGNYVEVYKKQADGSWKVAEDIATQEAPPAPVAPAAK
jgi:uncharacterized protein (TIGR02246 family)